MWTNVFGYDAAKRLTNVVSPAGEFVYTYASTASHLTRKIILPNTSYITNTYDNVARTLRTKLLNSSASVLDASSYGYNVGNQRFAVTNAAGASVDYAYDNIGQLKWADSVKTNGRTLLMKCQSDWGQVRPTKNISRK